MLVPAEGGKGIVHVPLICDEEQMARMRMARERILWRRFKAVAEKAVKEQQVAWIHEEQTAANEVRRIIQRIDREITGEEIAKELQVENIARGSPKLKPSLKMGKGYKYDGRHVREALTGCPPVGATEDFEEVKVPEMITNTTG